MYTILIDVIRESTCLCLLRKLSFSYIFLALKLIIPKVAKHSDHWIVF